MHQTSLRTKTHRSAADEFRRSERSEHRMAPALVTLDVLARLQLAAKRRGYILELTSASDELRELIDLAGLSDVLGVQTRGKPEEREQRLRVEEERELDDPPS